MKFDDHLILTQQFAHPGPGVRFRTMLTARLLEDRLQKICLAGEAGDLHFSKGQEAISTGVCAALRPTDHMVTHHRTIAHEVARGADLYKLVAEVLGKRTGFNGGRAGEMHISNPDIRHAFSFQLVGTCIPVAAGLAWALRYHHKNDEIVACFFGDAASSNGQFHEACTIAAIHKVPLLLVCENNGLAGNVTKDKYLPTANVAERMGSYRIPAKTIDGNDVRFVESSARLLLAWIRDGNGPAMLECLTERLCHHKQGQGDIRTKEKLAELALRDPLILEAERLGLSSDAQTTMENEINAEIDRVLERVRLDPVAEVG